jgi:hypothetical protein
MFLKTKALRGADCSTPGTLERGSTKTGAPVGFVGQARIVRFALQRSVFFTEC